MLQELPQPRPGRMHRIQQAHPTGTFDPHDYALMMSNSNIAADCVSTGECGASALVSGAGGGQAPVARLGFRRPRKSH